MKTIITIVIIFMALSSNAQTKVFKDAINNTTIDLILEYEKFCKEDSFKCYNFGIILDTITYYRNGFHVYKGNKFYYYEHTEPTFQGFIEWIKYKKEQLKLIKEQ